MEPDDLENALDELEQLRNETPQEQITTSAAKEYDPDGLKDTTLENAPDLGEAFDSAKGESIDPVDVAETQGVNSTQVSEDSSDLDARPGPEIAELPDRIKHESMMSHDDDAARMANYEAMAQDMNDMQEEPEQPNGYEM